MTAELWLNKPCEHGAMIPHNAIRFPDGSVEADPNGPCPGGSRVRLNPEQVLVFKPDPDRMGETIVYLDVQDIIDALEEK